MTQNYHHSPEIAEAATELGEAPPSFIRMGHVADLTKGGSIHSDTLGIAYRSVRASFVEDDSRILNIIAHEVGHILMQRRSGDAEHNNRVNHIMKSNIHQIGCELTYEDWIDANPNLSLPLAVVLLCDL